MRAKGLLAATALFALVTGWAAFWANRFFLARGEAERAMDQLQARLARGLASPELASQVEAALARSHEALTLALAGPVLIILLVFASLWLAARAPEADGGHA
ncbi:MAG TPA: hypothetical protein VGB59_05330 [Allosphingosinicella sp.]